MVQEVIHEVGILYFRSVWAKNLANKAVCPSTMTEAEQIITSYIIWALNGFNYTTLRVRYSRGGYVDIPMPVNKLNFKKHFKEIQAKKVLEQNKL
jgi:hypothetical protein